MEFNREQRRKLKKRMNKTGISLETAMELLERRMQAMSADALPEGTKVLLNYDAIVNQPGYKNRQSTYKEFVESNKDKEFTVEYDDKHTSGKLVCLAEDPSPQKWLWHAADLTPVKPVGESDSDSITPEGDADGNAEIQPSNVSEEPIPE